MKVLITSEVRANGTFIIERWPETGRELAHGPIPPESAEKYAVELKAAIMAQARAIQENLADMVRSDKQRAFFAPKDQRWLQRKRW